MGKTEMKLIEEPNRERTELVPIGDPVALHAAGIPYTPGLLRKWHHHGRYPRLFIKILRRVYIDLDEWCALVESAKAVRDRRAERIEGDGPKRGPGRPRKIDATTDSANQ